MKKISLLVVLVLILSGCFQSHRIISVKKDGSGTIEEKVLISSSMGGFMGNNTNYHKVDELTTNAISYGEGVKYISSREITKNGLSGYEVSYSFKDISKVKLDANAAGKMMEMEEEGEMIEYITFDFKKSGTAELKVIFPQSIMEDEADISENENWMEEEDYEEELSEEDQDMAMQMAKVMYGDMEISTKIIIDGKITSTDATHVLNNEVILNEIVFAEMLEDDNALKIMDRSKDMEGDKLMEMIKDFPGVKVEIKDEITIKFK